MHPVTGHDLGRSCKALTWGGLGGGLELLRRQNRFSAPGRAGAASTRTDFEAAILFCIDSNASNVTSLRFWFKANASHWTADSWADSEKRLHISRSLSTTASDGSVCCTCSNSRTKSPSVTLCIAPGCSFASFVGFLARRQPGGQGCTSDDRPRG